MHNAIFRKIFLKCAIILQETGMLLAPFRKYILIKLLKALRCQNDFLFLRKHIALIIWKLLFVKCFIIIYICFKFKTFMLVYTWLCMIIYIIKCSYMITYTGLPNGPLFPAIFLFLQWSQLFNVLVCFVFWVIWKSILKNVLIMIKLWCLLIFFCTCIF